MKPSLFAACAVALTAPAAAFAQADDTVTVTGQQPDPVAAAIADAPAPDAGAASGGSTTESVISYTPDYFAPYNPTSAWDMVNRVPGFNASGGGNARGFGANAGNVLINGERPSSKSQDISDILQRVPVGQVIRLDLIRGQVSGIDMGGQTVVVNVVRRVDTNSGGTWRVQSNYNTHTGVIMPNGEVNRNMRLLGANVTLGLQINQFPQGQRRRVLIYDAADTLIQHDEQSTKGNPPLGFNLTFNADRPLGEWELRLNGRYGKGGFGDRSFSERVEGLSRPRTRYDAKLNPIYQFPLQPFIRYDFEENRFRNRDRNAELGGDLERALTDDLTLKIIALQSLGKQDQSVRFSTHDAAGFISTLRSTTHARSGESILRSFVTWKATSEISVETGAEGAYNFRDNSTDIFIDSGSGFTPIPLPVSDTKVEELRAEPYVTMLWRPWTDWAFDASVQAEVSQIKQTGDAQQTRRFFYPKGSFSATWDVLERTQLRGTVERTVGQLSFGDFASSVNFSNSTQDTGNPDLVPEQTWTARLVAEQRFWDDGVVSLEYSRDWISDANGLVPLGNGVEGPGNLGDADRWKIKASIDAPLDRLGAPDARLQVSYEYSDSEVTDPVTGETRRLPDSFGGNNFNNNNGPRSLRVDFRKDYPEAGFSWGATYQNSSSSFSYRINEIDVNASNQGGVEAFVETTRFFGVNARLQIGNIGNFYNDQYRYLFYGPRDATTLAALEKRRQYNDLQINFRIRGNF